MKQTQISTNTTSTAHKEAYTISEMAVATERGNLFVKRTDCRVHGDSDNHTSGP